MTLRGHVDGKGDRRNQSITYLTSLCVWLTQQGLGDIAKKTNIIKSYKRQNIVERYDGPHPEGTWPKKKKIKGIITISSVLYS